MREQLTFDDLAESSLTDEDDPLSIQDRKKRSETVDDLLNSIRPAYKDILAGENLLAGLA